MSKTMTYVEAVREATAEELRRDESVYLIGEDVARWGNLFGCSRGLLKEFGPERIVDHPIAEAALAGIAVGSAVCGMRPICEIMYIDFASISMDQIINCAAKYHQLSRGKVKVPVVFRTEGGMGGRGSSQHSQSLETLFTNIPGLIVVMPSTPADVKGLLKASIRSDNPVVFIEHKGIYLTKGEVPEGDYTIPLGVADVKKSGKDITVIATSLMVLRALEAAEELEKEGISVEVVDPRTLWPLDRETISNSVKKTGRCVVVTEAPVEGGWSAEAAAVIQEECLKDLKAPVCRVGGLRTGIPYGAEMEQKCVPDKEWIKKAVLDTLSK